MRTGEPRRSEPIRVLIVDDHDMVRTAQPDVVLMDPVMPELDGGNCQ